MAVVLGQADGRRAQGCSHLHSEYETAAVIHNRHLKVSRGARLGLVKAHTVVQYGRRSHVNTELTQNEANRETGGS